MFNPILVQAQTENIQDLIVAVGGVLESITIVAFSIAFLVFLWGLAVFVFNSGNENKLADARRLMFWGIIILFVMISIWGIIQFLQVTFGTPSNPPQYRGVDDPSDIPPFGPGGPVSV